MEIPSKCKEIFLEGIRDVFIYPVEGSLIPVPFSVAHILSINNCSFPDPVLHIATDGENPVLSNNITVKMTHAIEGSGMVYSFSVSASLEYGSTYVREAYSNIEGKDHYIVLRTQEDKLLLCYTLPNTFTLESPQDMNDTGEQRTVAISTKAKSEFIPIVIR